MKAAITKFKLGALSCAMAVNAIASEPQVVVDNMKDRQNCQVVIGIDMSSSVPWNTSQDEMEFAVSRLVESMDGSLHKGDLLVIKPLGVFATRTKDNNALGMHPIRRDMMNKKGIERNVMAVINATASDQKETSILGFLHNLPRPDRKRKTCGIFLLSDGYESSQEFGEAHEFATGKPLPVRRENYLKGVELVFVGFGGTLDKHSSKINTGLEDAWHNHAEAAGAQLDIVSW